MQEGRFDSANGYGDEVLRRFRSSRRGAQPAGFSYRGEAEDRSLNVWVRFELYMSSERVIEASYGVFGCPHTIAAADWIAEWVIDKPVESIAQLDVHRLAAGLDVPTVKLGKLLRVEDALRECLDRITSDIAEGKQ